MVVGTGKARSAIMSTSPPNSSYSSASPTDSFTTLPDTATADDDDMDFRKEPAARREADGLMNPDQNWARKLFFMTADFIYPGMKTAFGTANGKRDVKVSTTKVGTSILVQTILNASVLIFVVWAFLYAISIQSMTSTLKVVHGKIYCIIFAMFVVLNIIRLVVGRSGNVSDNTLELTAYWLTTTLIQPPQLIFLFLSNLLIPTPEYRLISADVLMIAIMSLEIVVVFFRVRLLVGDELRLLRRETAGFKY